MSVLDIAALKLRFPQGVVGGSDVESFHDIIDTLEARTSQAVSVKTGDYMASLADDRSRIVFNTPSSVILTLPASLPKGWECMVLQVGTGSIIFGVPGGTLGSRDGHGRTQGRYATAVLYVVANTGNSPLVILSGDTTADTMPKFSSAFSSAFLR